MKKYNSARTCLKCGYGGIEDVWNPEIPEFIKALRRTIEMATASDLPEPPEHIARTCKNCGYSWQEGPLDEEENCSFDKFVDAFVKHASDATGMTREELLKEFGGDTDDPGVYVKTGLSIDDVDTQRQAKEALKRMDPPVIEVGDVVHACCKDVECKVIGIQNKSRCAVQSLKEPWCVCDTANNNERMMCLSDLTLIRKGPKVHTFKGVTWDIATLEAAPELERSSPFIGSENMEHFAKFESDGKRYTITATEEATP